MSVMQLKNLFCNGVWGIHHQGNMGESAKKHWTWVIQANEGGGPVNFTLGLYTKEDVEKHPTKGRLYFYVYAFGYRWYTGKS